MAGKPPAASMNTRNNTNTKLKEQTLLNFTKENQENKELNDKMSRLKRKLDSMISSLERREEDWKEKKQMWIKERQQWTEEKKAIEERISKLEWETEKAEREKRRPNIVIKGANIEGENLEKKVEEYIEQKIKIKVKIEKAKVISVNAGQNVRKLVVVRLANLMKGKEILQRKEEGAKNEENKKM
ncbi:calcium-binding and coiled-coil domain-containing protein 2-like [Copidosoma floridanum]|uniref:calcium-binding and coiled-coil domain-containing protein 2-like n=1 Tax=Copidosoma floridanum TaxID=29053 RepID=UPI000C6F8D8C|nr:calcium-binding and coiled-coil domain-containing protein 2-like [Copidosoma floridanum]